MKNLLVPMFLLLASHMSFGQDDLLNMLGDIEEEEEVIYTYGTFKTTRIINSQSVDIESKGEMQFLISHRFGNLFDGVETFYGLDDATIRLGLEYGVTERIAVGAGRSSDEAAYDVYGKYLILRQTENGNMPISMVWYTNATYSKRDRVSATYDYQLRHYWQYVNQLLIARKFSPKTSLQLMPTLIHRNIVVRADQPHQVYALGAGVRQKLTNRFSLTAEYYHLFNDLNDDAFSAPLVLGFEIETGGHVFMFNIGSSRGMTEKMLITRGTGSWTDTDKGLYLGFNISRNFNLNKKE
ncbi:DUF5777 family beta-barrel protein [Cytophagales bacterium LB-30]|uniref:DUF5777 family beta-barrel protein n=1 Tax=Shiella aurantiaca TaxID=3058365 RepID=A0ABT8F8F9_9BACT|nr:DUF5777 family beta-barrel protein [Shiella aurantiaca]MDN4166524.1 DUF5777 family beta-barrel protein [Shiella aurantiaca]